MARPLLLLLALAATGCLKVRERLTVNADGSGTLVIETSALIRASVLTSMRAWRAEGMDVPFYPPLNDAEGRQLFAGKGLTVDAKPNPSKDALSGAIVRVTFQDINALLDSPYGRARALALAFEGDRLVLRARAGLAGVVLLAESKQMQIMSGIQNVGARKKDMAAAFTVTLPNPIAETDGARDGKTATWSLERAKTKTLDEAIDLFRRPMQAACPREGIAFTPRPVVRLDGASFADLREGDTGRKLPVPDPAEVAKAARFLPYSITVTKSFDLTGEGGYSENVSAFAGAVTLPRALVPAQWGAATFTEILDDRGRSLKLGVRRRRSGPDGHVAQRGAASKPTERIVHPVTVQFQVPEPSVKAIRSIRGQIVLHYFAGQHVVKIENAIDTAGHARAESAALKALNVQIEIDDVKRNDDSLRFSLELSGSAALDRVQGFAAGGKPWPTLVGRSGETALIHMPGKPKTPVALALLLRTSGTPVTVPLRLDNLSLERKPTAKPKKPEQE
ncbi:hypothetical protein HQ560_01315 [bacterium]|nr:hypothetical protein [bacterium]